jgi:ABC-type multidrug transport system fused ATPase/permease subunit
LKKNVALGVPDDEIDMKKVELALKQSQLFSLLCQLPQGVETLLGERGIRLSGGQRQRVALARAFYHDRDVLIMDEATSALDNETEKEIVSEIQLLKGKKTLIVIAHRLSTIEHCDRILRLERGRFIEENTPDNEIIDA